jgi:S1-C subfamily serine protease
MRDPLADEPASPNEGPREFPPRDLPYDYTGPDFVDAEHSGPAYATHDYTNMPEPPEAPSGPRLVPAEPVPSFPHRPARSMAVAMLAAGLVLGSIGGGAIGALIATHRNTTVAQNNTGTVSSGVAAPAPSPGSYAAIYQQTKDGVVTITTQTGGNGFRSFSQAEGSGVVVDKQGDIVTNAHVVDGASSVQVAFSNGQSVTGQVKGVDRSADLAVVQVSVSQDQLHPLAMGNSDTLQVGDTALAIGAPFGLQGSFTSGIISGLNRTTTAPNGRALTGMIQTDAPINPGNSGGALLDGRGQLIGINDSIDSPVEGNVGVGFAIPVNRASSLLKPLEQGKAIQHPWLGISGETLTPTTASQLGINGANSGVLVVDVVANGPAAKAGLQGSGQADASDDVITAIDGHSISTIDALTAYLDTKNVGDKVTLSVTRNGQHLSIKVTLGNFQAQPSTTP